MLQQINLYKEQKRQKIVLPCMQIIIILAGFSAILVVVSIYMVYGYYKTAFELRTLQLKQEKLNKGLVSVQKAVPTEEEKEQMQKHLTDLQQEKAYKQKMYTTLKQLHYQDSAGLVGYLNSLAEQTVTDVWLTKFHFTNNGAGVSLEGFTLDSSSVPRYLQALGKTQMFSGKSFDRLQIFLDDKTKQIKFIIGTE